MICRFCLKVTVTVRPIEAHSIIAGRGNRLEMECSTSDFHLFNIRQATPFFDKFCFNDEVQPDTAVSIFVNYRPVGGIVAVRRVYDETAFLDFGEQQDIGVVIKALRKVISAVDIDAIELVDRSALRFFRLVDFFLRVFT